MNAILSQARQGISILLILLLLFSAAPLTVFAAENQTVANTRQGLQNLIDQSVSSGNGTTAITISQNFVFDGTPVTVPSGLELTLQAGRQRTLTQTKGRHFVVEGKLSLQKITLNGGGAGGGVNVKNGGTFVMGAAAVIQSCHAEDKGGAVESAGVVLMNGGKIAENTAGTPETSGLGGGVYLARGGKLTVNGSTAVIEKNRAEGSHTASPGNGGGVYVSSGGDFQLLKGAIRENEAAQLGGGVCAEGGQAIVLVEGGTISNNKASVYGGGVCVNDQATFELRGSGEISGNTLHGVSALKQATFIMAGGAVSGHTSPFPGGGVYVDESIMAMSGGEIKDNATTASGGAGIWVSEGHFTMTDGSVTGNTAAGSGGGMFLWNAKTAVISGGSITGNKAKNGGAVAVSSGSKLVLEGGTLKSNQADKNGGAISVSADSMLQISGKTPVRLEANQAPSGDGGGIYTADADYMNVKMSANTVLEKNQAQSAGQPPAITPADIKSVSVSVRFPNQPDSPLNNYDINYKGSNAVYPVTYEANGGSGAGPSATPQAFGSVFAAAKNTFTPPAGCLFVEWNTEADGTGTSYPEDGSVVMGAEPVTLYAMWSGDYQVTEKYRLYGDAGKELRADTFQSGVAGSPYSKTAPEIPGYVAVGWYGGDYSAALTESEIHHIAKTGDDVKASVSLVRGKSTVTYIYRKQAAPVKVIWSGLTASSGIPVSLGAVTVNGWVGEQVQISVTDLALDSRWELLPTSPVHFDLTLSGAPDQMKQFTFKENPNYTSITVNGESLDGTVSYSYTTGKKQNDSSFLISGWNVSGYRIDKWTVYSSADLTAALGSGSGDTVSVDPAKGDQTVKFTYVSTQTKVLVKAIDKTTGAVINTHTFTDAVTGGKYVVAAPHMNGYRLAPGQPLLMTIDPVDSGTNVVEFQYINAGNVVLRLKDSATDAVLKEITVEKPETIAPGDARLALTDAYYTYDAVKTAAANNGAPLLPLTVSDVAAPAVYSIYYSKDVVDVKITAVNSKDNAVLKTQILPKAARKGEMYAASALNVPLFELAESNLKSVYVDPAVNPLEISFLYDSISQGNITVRSYYMEHGSKTILNEYTGSAAVGSDFSAEAGAVDGFLFEGSQSSAGNGNHKVKIAVSSDPQQNVIEFLYSDVRKSITIETQLDDQSAVVSQIQKYPSGTETRIYAPSVTDYVLSGYQVDSGSVTQIPPGFNGIDFTGANAVQEDHTIRFCYTSLKEVISDSYVLLTVKAQEENRALSQLVIRVPVGVDEIVLAPEIPGYTLDSAQAGNYSDGTVGGILGRRVVNMTANGIHTFHYKKNTAAITVDFIDVDTGNTVSGQSAQVVTGTIGDTLTVNAPPIINFELAPGESATKSHIITGAGDKVDFRYRRSNGNVRFQYISDEDDAILVQVSENLALGGSTTGIKPVKEPQLPDGWELKNGGGTPVYSEDVVTPNTVVTFRLTKQMEEITVYYYKKGTAEPVAASTKISGQVGQNITVLAEPRDLQAGYMLSGSPYQACKVMKGGANEVIFYYEDRSGAGASALTMIGQDTEGNILYYLTEPAVAEGTPYTAKPPSLPGWKKPEHVDGSDPVSGTIQASGAKVVFRYEMDMIEVPVYVQDQSGKALAGVHYLDHAARLYQKVAVQISHDKTISAPHFNDYLLNGAGSVRITDAGVGSEAVFTYQPLANTMVQIEIKGQSGGEELYSYTITRPKDASGNTVEEIKAFTVPGYKAKVVQASIPTDGSVTSYTFDYGSLSSTVTIHMVDGKGAPVETSFRVSAMTGKPYTRTAPYVPGWYLTDDQTVKTVDSVKEDGTSKLTFYYEKIQNPVVFVAKENNSSGRIIRSWDVDAKNLVKGKNLYALPDLSADAYTATMPTIEFQWDGSTATVIEGYYTRMLTDIYVSVVDKDSGKEIPGASYQSVGHKKGDIVTVLARDVDGYVLESEPAAVVETNASEKAEFHYRKLGQDEVAVKAVDVATGILLQSYVISSAQGNVVKADAPEIMGWVLAAGEDKEKEAVSGIQKEMIFHYAPNIAIVAVKLADNHGKELHVAGYDNQLQVAKGGRLELHAPHVPGYMLDTKASPAVRVLASVTSNQTLTFTYRSLEDLMTESFAKIEVVEQCGGKQLNSYTANMAVSAGTSLVTAGNHTGYKLAGVSVADESGKETANTLTNGGVLIDPAGGNQKITFLYDDLAANVTIRMVDNGNPDVEIGTSFAVAASAGSPFTYNAPDVAGYYLVSSSVNGKPDGQATIGTIAEVGPASQEIVFSYAKINSTVLLVAKEDDTNGRVIRTYEIPVEQLSQGSNSWPSPDLNAGFYTALQEQVTIDWDGMNSVKVEAYYEKQLTTVDIHCYEAGVADRKIAQDQLTGQRTGEAVTISAPVTPGYRLVSGKEQTVIAGSTAPAEFYYANTKGRLHVTVVDSATGNKLPEATVKAVVDGGADVYSETTDENGAAAFQNVSHGVYAISAQAAGYQEGSVTAVISDRQSTADVYIALVKPAKNTSRPGGGGGNGGGGGDTAGLDNDKDVAGERDKQSENDNGQSPQAEHHIAYLSGYPDKTVRPDHSITRAETAMIFYRLAAGRFAASKEAEAGFPDVAAGMWYTEAIDALAGDGVLSGYPDGSFRPDEPVTRAEFASLAARFGAASEGRETPFTDLLPSHWAYGQICAAYEKRWITGYPDNTFRPERTITRAEAVTIVNAIFDRKADEKAIRLQAAEYGDLQERHWAFSEIMEASIAHDYTREQGAGEVWLPDTIRRETK